VIDVRDPAEYRAGHLPGSVMAPGGQLVQETDSWLGVWGARVVLVDDTGVRARMTASWLKRMGWDAAVRDHGLDGAALETGMPAADTSMFPIGGPEPAAISPQQLQADRSAVVVDLALSRRHREGHIPGAWFAVRARLGQALDKLPASGDLVLTSEDGVAARYAAAEIGARRPVKVLAGGTAAWAAAGLPLETGMAKPADEPDDVALSARDRPAERERFMREYLAWEIELVNQIARDDDCRFHLAPTGS
jgi:rhodanese-related sulfurtransferase